MMPERMIELLDDVVNYVSVGRSIHEQIQKLSSMGFLPEELESYGYVPEEIQDALNNEQEVD